MEMESNKPSDVQHPLEEKVGRTFRRRSPPDLNQIKYQMDSKNLNNFITFVKLEDLPDIVPPEERLVQLGFDDQVFDSKTLPFPRYGCGPVAIPDFKKDPSKFLSITKSATLAIRDYNLQTRTDYQLLDIEMVNWQGANGFLYHMTFQAMNADKEYATFEATVLRKLEFRKVKRIKMKGTSTWYDGTLMQLEDYAPITMDPNDHFIGAYDLIKVAQRLKKPDMGSVMAKQDEGAESAGSLPE